MGLALLQSRQARQVLLVLLGAVLSWRGDSVGASVVLGDPHGICASRAILCSGCGGRQSPADKLVSWEVLADPLPTGRQPVEGSRLYQTLCNTLCYFTFSAL